MEQANLKLGDPAKYADLKAAHDLRESQMLPMSPEAHSHDFTGADLADHYGAKIRNSVDKPGPAR